MSKRVFKSPAKYVQGAGLLASLGEELAHLGRRVLVVSDAVVWDLTKDTISASLERAGLAYAVETFGGESSAQEVSRLAGLGKQQGSDIVMGLGGGKSIDTAKAVADELNAATVIVPTAASTDAPTSGLSVLYSPEGAFDQYRFFAKNPDLVLLDTAVIARAPVRMFASGMADAMATAIEVRATLRTNSDAMAGGKPTLAAVAIAEACERVLFEQGVAAYQAVAKKIVTPHVENVIEANTLLSGLGFENGGLAAAHSVHDGFTALHGDIHLLTHGEKVAYGTLVQLVLEGRPIAELQTYLAFYKAIKMPTTLAELHLEDASYDDFLKVGELANGDGDTMANLNANLSAEDIAQAILAVDVLGRAL